MMITRLAPRPPADVEKWQRPIAPQPAPSDVELHAAALAAIAQQPEVPANACSIEVAQGVVTICGRMEWFYQRSAAELAVRFLSGVREIRNEIVVAPARLKEKVLARIERTLLWAAELDAHRIRIDVQGDVVVLSGCVSSSAERSLAEHATGTIPGVGRIDNRIEVSELAPAGIHW